MLAAIERGADIEPPRAAVLEFLTGELLPHAAAEEERLYPAATRTERARPLVEAMIAVHRIIGALVERIRTESPVRAAAAGHALRVLFEAHLPDENERILRSWPPIQRSPCQGHPRMHELLGAPNRERGHWAANGAAPSHPRRLAKR